MNTKDDRTLAGAKNRQLMEVSRRVVSPTIAESKHRAGYTTIMVKSLFEGPDRLYDLLHNITRKKLLNHRLEEHRPSKSGTDAV